MAAAALAVRGYLHDQSKLSEAEIGPLAEMQALVDREGPAPFGSDKYKQRTEMLQPMLKHHYENNSHHPEHYEDGVDGMDLFDLMEMFFDWKAASERNDESAMSITTACERFRIAPQLERILKNTAERCEFKYK